MGEETASVFIVGFCSNIWVNLYTYIQNINIKCKYVWQTEKHTLSW